MQRWIPQTELQKEIDTKLRTALEAERKRQIFLFNELKKLIEKYYKSTDEFGLDWNYLYNIQEFLRIYDHCLDESQDYYKQIIKTERPNDINNYINNYLIMRRIYRDVHDHYYLNGEMQQFPLTGNWLPENSFQIKLDNDFKKAFELKGKEREDAFMDLSVTAYVMTTLENQLLDVNYFAWNIHSLAKIEAGILHSGTRRADEVLDGVYEEVNEAISMSRGNDKQNYYIHSTSDRKYIRESTSELARLMINNGDKNNSIEQIKILLDELKNNETYVRILLNAHVVAQKQIQYEITKLREQGYNSYDKNDKSFENLNFIVKISSLIEHEIAIKYNYSYKDINRARVEKRTERKNNNPFFSKVKKNDTIPAICSKIESTINNIAPDKVDFSLKPEKSAGKYLYQIVPNKNSDLKIANINALWIMYQGIVNMDKKNDNRVEAVIELAEQFLKAAGPHLTNNVSFRDIYEEVIYKTYDLQHCMKNTNLKSSFFGKNPEFLNLLVLVFSQAQSSDKNPKIIKNEIRDIIEMEQYKYKKS